MTNCCFNFQNYMSGGNTYFCKPIYNISNPTAWNMGETLAMQLSANTFAQMTLYNVPAFNYNNLNSFQFGGDLNSVFTNLMNNTMQQFQWQMNNGCMNFGFGGFPMFNIGAAGSGTSSGSTNLTEEDKKKEALAEKEYKKLAALINHYKNTHSDKIDDSLKYDIENAIKKGSKTYVEALATLKDVYKTISQKDNNGLKETLTVFDDTVASSAGITQKYNTILKNSGYEYTGNIKQYAGCYEFNLENLYDELNNKVTVKDYKADNLAGILALNNGEISKSNILEFLSAWNSTYGNTNKSVIRTPLQKMKDENCKYEKSKSFFEGTIKSVADDLVERGRYTAGLLDDGDSDKTKLTSLSKDLEDAITAITSKTDEKPSANNLNKLETCFDQLYVVLRLVEAKNAQKSIKADYGFLNNIATDDTDIIDNSIVENTKADLKAEGFTESDINGFRISAESDVPANNHVGGSDSAITKENILENGYSMSTSAEKALIKKHYLENTTNEVDKEVKDKKLVASSFDNIYKKGNKFYVFNNNGLVELAYSPSKRQ